MKIINHLNLFSYEREHQPQVNRFGWIGLSALSFFFTV